MKYTPKNPNEHKFKPSMPKLKGFQKKQPRKKKNKTVITIKTNKMSIMDILFSGQKLPQLQGLMRQSYFNSLCYQCQPKFYGFEYTTYKFDIKWPKQRAYNFKMIEASIDSRGLKSSIYEILEYNLKDVELTERFNPTAMYPNIFTGISSGFDSDMNSGLRLTYEPYSEYEETDVLYRLGTSVSVVNNGLLAEDIVQDDRFGWTRYNLKTINHQMRHTLIQEAIDAGIDIDKWKYNMNMKIKREHMLVCV